MTELLVVVALQGAVVVWAMGCAILISSEFIAPYLERPKGWPWLIPLWPLFVAWGLWGRRAQGKKRGRP